MSKPKTVKFPGARGEAPPPPATADLHGHIKKVTTSKGKINVVFEADIADPEQHAAKRLLDLQHGAVDVRFVQAED